MPQPLAPAVRERIVDHLRDGKARNEIARLVGCGAATVTRIARAEGLGLDWSSPKKATEARRDYDQTARLALLNAGFDKASELLDVIATPSHFQTWSVALATLIDKRRLEDGEATSRTDVVTTDARDRIARRIDELAARRDTHRAAG